MCKLSSQFSLSIKKTNKQYKKRIHFKNNQEIKNKKLVKAVINKQTYKETNKQQQN